MKNYLVILIAVVCGSWVQAAPFVTTFVNTSNININVELHYSDNSTTTKGIAMSQSYQAVNFANKIIVSVVLSSEDKDQNGNFYGQLNQNFTAPTADVTYNIALQAVPAHTVAASQGTDAFEMPATQTITCNVASATSVSSATSSTPASSGVPAATTTATVTPAADSLPVPITTPAFKK